MCYVRQIRYRMHVSNAIFKGDGMRIAIHIQVDVGMVADAFFARCRTGWLVNASSLSKTRLITPYSFAQR